MFLDEVGRTVFRCSGGFFFDERAKFTGPGFGFVPFLLNSFAASVWRGFTGGKWTRVALLPPFVAAIKHPDNALVAALHIRFVVHAILFVFLAVASLIDLDERIIPDTVTMPGTLLGLLLVSLFPLAALLPVVVAGPEGNMLFGSLTITSPYPFPEWFGGYPHCASLITGLAAWWFWVFALLPRTWYSRHGVKRAMVLMWERLRREPITIRLLLLGVVGTIVIGALWLRGQLDWLGLLTGLVGMIAGTLIIWAVRIVGSRSLQSEAMGFGDVTLMAMIGVYVGWQSCLVIFFLAPFFALGIGILNYLIRRDKAIPYGPFLCLGTVTLILFWQPIWARMQEIFLLGWIIPLIMTACMVLMGIMLTGWRIIREMIWGE